MLKIWRLSENLMTMPIPSTNIIFNFQLPLRFFNLKSLMEKTVPVSCVPAQFATENAIHIMCGFLSSPLFAWLMSLHSFNSTVHFRPSVYSVKLHCCRVNWWNWQLRSILLSKQFRVYASQDMRPSENICGVDLPKRLLIFCSRAWN